MPTTLPSIRQAATTFALCLASGLCAAQGTPSPMAAPAAAAPPSVRLRGVVQSVTPEMMTIKERSGEVIPLVLSSKLVVNEVYPIALSDVKAGSYIGTAAMPQPDGTQRAIAVTVFPESARGVAEGSYPFDLRPESTMTNATVADVVAAPTGRTLQVRYKDGAKTIVVPPEAPVVSFRPGDRSLLVPGASVSLSAQAIDGKPTAMRVNAGRDGFPLPY